MIKKYVFLFFLFCFQNLFAFKTILISEKIDEAKNRIYKNMVLITKKENIYFCLSLPLNVPQKNLYTIIVMAGLETGKKNLQYISDMGDYAFIGYEYPDILKKNPNIFIVFMVSQ